MFSLEKNYFVWNSKSDLYELKLFEFLNFHNKLFEKHLSANSRKVIVVLKITTSLWLWRIIWAIALNTPPPREPKLFTKLLNRRDFGKILCFSIFRYVDAQEKKRKSWIIWGVILLDSVYFSPHPPFHLIDNHS